MLTAARVGIGLLLLVHGLVHLLYVAPDVPEFSYERSWIVPEGARRPLALALLAATVAAFALLALAVWGVPGLSGSWPLLAVVASVLSALLLVAFWRNQLVLGLVIDAALVVVALERPHWADRIVGGGG